MGKRILFYSSVATKKQFVHQEYYKIDIKILRKLGHTVSLSRHWYDFLAFWRYDIAFIYFYRFGLIPAAVARIFARRVYFTGGIDYLDRKFSSRREHLIQAIFYNLCGALSTRNIIVSDSDLRNCERVRFLFPATRQVVSKHCVTELSSSVFHDGQREKLVLTVAWMARTENVIRKGVLESLELFQAIFQQDSAFRLVVIGPKGDGSRLVERRIDELGLTNCVRLTGGVSEVTKIGYLSRACIYLQLSKYEGFGIAAIEALAAGCLVVHSGAGGLAEGVGQRGLLWRPSDPIAVVPEIFELLGNRRRYAEWIHAGRDYTAHFYSEANRAEVFAKILQ